MCAFRNCEQSEAFVNNKPSESENPHKKLTTLSYVRPRFLFRCKLSSPLLLFFGSPWRKLRLFDQQSNFCRMGHQKRDNRLSDECKHAERRHKAGAEMHACVI